MQNQFIIDESYNLSSIQKSHILFLNTKNLKSFCSTFIVHLKRKVDIAYLKQSISTVVDSIPLFTSIFTQKADKFTPVKAFTANELIREIFFNNFEEAKIWMNKQSEREINLISESSLFNAYLIFVEAEIAYLFVKYHPILMDQKGQSNFLDKIRENYKLLIPSKDFSCPDKAIHYGAFNAPSIASISEPKQAYETENINGRPSTLLGDYLHHKLRQSADFLNVPLDLIIASVYVTYIHEVTQRSVIRLSMPLSSRRTYFTQPISMNTRIESLVIDFSEIKSEDGKINTISLVRRIESEIKKLLSINSAKNKMLLNKMLLSHDDLVDCSLNIFSAVPKILLGNNLVRVEQLSHGLSVRSSFELDVFLSQNQINFSWNNFHESNQEFEEIERKFMHFIEGRYVELCRSSQAAFI